MPKATLNIVTEDEDGGVSLKATEATDDGGDPSNPTDPVTGENQFDDIDSRFGMPKPGKAGREEKDETDEDDDQAADDEMFGKDTAGGPADEDDEPEDAEEEDEEEEGPRRSGFRKRLAREQRLRREAEENFRDMQDRLAEVEKTLSSRQTDDAFAAEQSALDEKISGKEKELAAAIEGGDVTAQIRLNGELLDLKVDKRTKADSHERSKTATEKSRTAANPIVDRKIAQWKRKHQRYNSDPEFAALAHAIDKQIAKEGFNPETEEFWDELDDRLSKRFPEEYRGRKTDGRPRSKAPTRSFRQDGTGSRPTKKIGGEFPVDNKGRVRLTKDHVENMRRFNLDPKNPQHVKAYVDNNT